MDPADFQRIAEILIEVRDAGAAHHRSAIGRAYYAAYNVAAILLADLGWSISRTAKGHDQVVQLLQNSGDAELNTIGGLLGDLRVARNHADYDMTRRDVEKGAVAKAKVATARAIIDELHKFLASEPRKSKALPQIQIHYDLITRGIRPPSQ